MAVQTTALGLATRGRLEGAIGLATGGRLAASVETSSVLCRVSFFHLKNANPVYRARVAARFIEPNVAMEDASLAWVKETDFTDNAGAAELILVRASAILFGSPYYEFTITEPTGEVSWRVVLKLPDLPECTFTSLLE